MPLITYVLSSLGLVALLLGPLVAFALIIHFFESGIQLRLARAFGWRSVMFTGWLGTPIHELSHVVGCLIFRHRIDEVKLFSPDLASGQLGYVRHSYRKGNRFEELGNVFIGTAPLLGGTLVLLLLLTVLYPAETRALLSHEAITQVTTWQALPIGFLSALSEFFQNLFSPQNLGTPRLWVFLYLTLCVATHMAPSRSDYEGAALGIGSVLLALWLTALFLLAFSGDPLEIALEIFRQGLPVLLVGTLAVALCGVAWLVVHLLTLAVGRF